MYHRLDIMSNKISENINLIKKKENAISFLIKDKDILFEDIKLFKQCLRLFCVIPVKEFVT